MPGTGAPGQGVLASNNMFPPTDLHTWRLHQLETGVSATNAAMEKHFDRVESKMDAGFTKADKKIENRFGSIDEIFRGMGTKLDSIEKSVLANAAGLDKIEGKFEGKFESVDKDLKKIDSRLDKDLEKIDKDLEKIHSGLDKISETQIATDKTLSDLQKTVELLDVRIMSEFKNQDEKRQTSYWWAGGIFAVVELIVNNLDNTSKLLPKGN